ncbi:hypothetical protein MAPG_10219, partial [Magnaporthiopsis poae ATCC 64411]
PACGVIRRWWVCGLWRFPRSPGTRSSHQVQVPSNQCRPFPHRHQWIWTSRAKKSLAAASGGPPSHDGGEPGNPRKPCEVRPHHARTKIQCHQLRASTRYPSGFLDGPCLPGERGNNKATRTATLRIPECRRPRMENGPLPNQRRSSDSPGDQAGGLATSFPSRRRAVVPTGVVLPLPGQNLEGALGKKKKEKKRNVGLAPPAVVGRTRRRSAATISRVDCAPAIRQEHRVFCNPVIRQMDAWFRRVCDIVKDGSSYCSYAVSWCALGANRPLLTYHRPSIRLLVPF